MTSVTDLDADQQSSVLSGLYLSIYLVLVSITLILLFNHLVYSFAT